MMYGVRCFSSSAEAFHTVDWERCGYTTETMEIARHLALHPDLKNLGKYLLLLYAVLSDN